MLSRPHRVGALTLSEHSLDALMLSQIHSAVVDLGCCLDCIAAGYLVIA